MRVVVTGGAGYIGSVVTDQLIADGHDVLVIDDLTKGHRDAVHDAAFFVQVDLAERAEVAAGLYAFGAEAVVHMAAASLVGESMEDPAKYYRANMTTGLALLDAMRQTSVSRIVFSSTAAVYGSPNKLPIEESDPTNPTNPYGVTKLAFEQALRWYGAAYGLSSISLRYFNAAGATDRRGERHDPETHLIPVVLDAAAGRRQEVVVFGDTYDTPDGTCVRDYIHVEDLARAHTLALHHLNVPGQSRAYNLGCGGAGYSVRHVIDTAVRVTGNTIPSRVVAPRSGDPATLVASSQQISRDLGWEPRWQQLEHIIDSAWRWTQGRLAGMVSATPRQAEG
jgi:UDP-glucose 4-epimerase